MLPGEIPGSIPYVLYLLLFTSSQQSGQNPFQITSGDRILIIQRLPVQNPLSYPQLLLPLYLLLPRHQKP